MPDKKFSIVIAFLFLAAISLPAVQTGCNALWGTDAPASAPEDRKTPPLDSWFSRMRASGDYFNEHFGLREFLIRWNNIARVEALSTSPIPHAILGKNGWLFYLSEPVDDGNTIQDYRGLSPLSPGHPQETQAAPGEGSGRPGKPRHSLHRRHRTQQEYSLRRVPAGLHH